MLATDMRKSKIYNEIFNAIQKQIDKRQADIQDYRDQMDISTATWGLKIFEKEFDIRGRGEIEDRRMKAIITARSRLASGKVDSDLLSAVASSFIGHKVEVDFIDGRIHFIIPTVPLIFYHEVQEFHTGMTLYKDIESFDFVEMVRAIEDIRPSHLRPIYFPVINEQIAFSDRVTVRKKTYHEVQEFRVGMTPIKSISEVVV